ncbi:hypothetical protein C0J52_09756 [Blattella germanica]|nr:hypothetical protein C0J52_09756 [Blattella germanica]
MEGSVDRKPKYCIKGRRGSAQGRDGREWGGNGVTIIIFIIVINNSTAHVGKYPGGEGVVRELLPLRWRITKYGSTLTPVRVRTHHRRRPGDYFHLV